jgi:hypothetical protein
MNLRDKILTAEDIPSKSVTIPEWDVELLVKGMSAGDRLLLMQNAFDQATQQVNLAIVYPDVVVACACDPETGEPVFTDADKPELMKKASAAIERLATVGLQLSGIGQEEQDAAGKDSSSIPSEDSSSS